MNRDARLGLENRLVRSLSDEDVGIEVQRLVVLLGEFVDAKLFEPPPALRGILQGDEIRSDPSCVSLHRIASHLEPLSALASGDGDHKTATAVDGIIHRTKPSHLPGLGDSRPNLECAGRWNDWVATIDGDPLVDAVVSIYRPVEKAHRIIEKWRVLFDRLSPVG